MHNPDTLKNLLTTGAGIRVDAKAISINTLNELAALAHAHEARLSVFNANHILKDSLERLATIGGQCIAFEF